MRLSERLAARRRDRALLDAARGLERHGLVVGTVGNVSVRDGDRVRITPTEASYARMRARDLVTVDLAGRTPPGTAPRRLVRGRGRPSRELPLHLEIYRAREDVAAVVHAHGTYAAAWSFLGIPLEPAIEELSYYGIGAGAVSPPAPAGSSALGLGAVAALGPTAAAALIGAHGLVAVGEDPARALLVARVVEHHARIAWLLRGQASADQSGVSPDVSDILAHGR